MKAKIAGANLDWRKNAVRELRGIITPHSITEHGLLNKYQQQFGTALSIEGMCAGLKKVKKEHLKEFLTEESVSKTEVIDPRKHGYLLSIGTQLKGFKDEQKAFEWVEKHPEIKKELILGWPREQLKIEDKRTVSKL